MHNTIGGGPAILGAPLAAPVRLLNKLVHGTIRMVTRLVGASISVQPLEGGLRILGYRRLSQFGHAGGTHTSDDCCGVGRVQNDTAGLVLPRSTVCPDRSRYPNQISPGPTAARAATRRRVLALAYRVRRANLTLRIRLRRRDDAA